jgi:hypothetical protein
MAGALPRNLDYLLGLPEKREGHLLFRYDESPWGHGISSFRVWVCPCRGKHPFGDYEKEHHMRNGGIGGSLFLAALGAVLYWGVSVEGEGFNLNTIGVILMVAGAIGLVLTLLMSGSGGDGGSDVTIIDR